MNIKLTVIIPCFNFENYITTSVDSVLSQITNFNYEILIIDDCSTDNSYKIIKEKYSNIPNIHIFQSPKNRGITLNLKEMIELSQGQYIITLDGDDYLVDNYYFDRAVTFLDLNKQYSMYCAGYKWLNSEGSYIPSDGVFVSNLSDVHFKDILEINHITTGRIFRKYKNIIHDWIDDNLHEDWAINAVILKHGPARCEKDFVTVYRITNTGRITSLNQNQILEKNNHTVSKIKSHLTYNVITVIDSFVHNENIRQKLSDMLDWMLVDGYQTCLVSNTVVDCDILKKVNFYLYDSRNQLFSENYDVGSNLTDYWTVVNDSFEIHRLVPELQRHGLSVLINLFNSLLYAKNQGYTHFQRLEVDDIYGPKSREFLKTIPDECIRYNKKGLFYYNEGKNQTTDVSFHYFFSEIDTFLAKIVNIFSENDYINYLKLYNNNNKFKIVEVFLYENLKRNGDDCFIKKNGEIDMRIDFSDVRWNTESTISGVDKKYKNCVTSFYYICEYDDLSKQYIRKNSYVVLTHSQQTRRVSRKIELTNKNDEITYIYHTTNVIGEWIYNFIPDDIKSMSVYEDDVFLYTEFIKDCISYIKLKS